MRPGGRPPAALAADAVHHLRLRAVELVGGRLCRVGDEAVDVDAGLQLGQILAGAAGGLAIEIEERGKPARLRRR